MTIAATNLHQATICESDTLRVGEIVLAVGNPLGDTNALTTGIISQVQQNSIIADIQLFPGNSGGAITNCRGDVIGINTMIAYGLAVAISTTTVERFLATANNISKPRRLGVTLKPVIISAKRQTTLGLLVLSVNHRSYAEAAGVQIGDIIFAVWGRFLQQVEDLTYYLQLTNDKELLALQILRGGTQIVVNVAFDKDKTTCVSS